MSETRKSGSSGLVSFLVGTLATEAWCGWMIYRLLYAAYDVPEIARQRMDGAGVVAMVYWALAVVWLVATLFTAGSLVGALRRNKSDE